jgi:hypothetical protein
MNGTTTNTPYATSSLVCVNASRCTNVEELVDSWIA